MLSCHGAYAYAALRQALLWRSNVDLFSSKLTVLNWDAPSKYIEYLPPLVTSTLQILKVQLNAIEIPNTLDVLHQTILLRSPSLRSFKLGFPPANDNAQAVSRSLDKLFSLLSGLVFILIPSHCMTGELFTTLSRLPQLQELSLPYEFYFLYMSGDDEREMLLKRKIDDDEETRKDIPFHSLEKIHISYFDFMVAEILRRGIQLLRLIDLTYSGSYDRTITFMKSLHRICPNLEKISIFTNDKLPIPFQAIRLLLKCPALVEIVSHRNIDMKLEDIVTIATSRSSWQVIDLPSVEPLGYQVLVAFAQNCPDLHKLSLTLDSKLGIPDLDTFTTDVRFSSLTSLHIIGDSALTPDFQLALFLSKICSKPIEIEGGHKLWKTVEKLANTIITTRLENRILKDENTLLRAKKCSHDF